MANQRGMNRVDLIGHLMEDPIERQARSGALYLLIKLAVNTEQPGRSGSEPKLEVLRCQLYNGGGVARYLTKGKHVGIEGRLEGYQREEGPIQMTVNIDRIMLLGSRDARPVGSIDPEYVEEYVEELQQRNAHLMEQHDKLVAEIETLRAAQSSYKNPVPAPAKKAAKKATAKKKAGKR